MTRAPLPAIRTDFEAGLGRAEIRRRHGCTPGQLASWARRLGWHRPPPVVLVKMLTGQQRTAYRRLCRWLPRAEALARVYAEARTAPPGPGRAGRRRAGQSGLG